MIVGRTVPDQVDYRGSFIGDLGRAVGHIGVGVVGGFLKGGVPGAIVGAVKGTVTATQANIDASRPTGGSNAGVPMIPQVAPPGAMQSMAPTPGTAVTVSRRGGHPTASYTQATSAFVTTHKGYHLSKPRKGQVQHAVRNRRMNWANARALTRAGRRVSAFVHHARRFLKMTHSGRTGQAHFKFGRKRKRAA